MDLEKHEAACRAWYLRNRDRLRELAKSRSPAERAKRNEYGREHYRRNRESILARMKARANPERKRVYNRNRYQKNRKEMLASAHRYWESNKDKLRKGALAYYYRMMKTDPDGMRAKRRVYRRKRYAEDPQYRMRVNLGRNIRNALMGASKIAKTEELVGCSWSEFLIHIEKLWLPGMSWENHGLKDSDWQLDHVKPSVAFDLLDPIQQKICFHYSNLRPLWRRENHSKGSLWNGVRVRRKTKPQNADAIL